MNKGKKDNEEYYLLECDNVYFGGLIRRDLGGNITHVVKKREQKALRI
jgi:hypothetical protein